MLGVVLLMFSLCDADSSCPEELNPLSLDPSEIIEEYGTQVIVNCTSTVPEHEGMHWTVSNKSFEIEGVQYFITQSVLLSDWNVSAECKIRFNDSDDCSKELEITIYKNPEVNSSLKLVSATPGKTQYELMCDVIDVAPVQNLNVRWYKNDELIETISFNDTTKTPVTESSVHTFTIGREEGEVQIRCEAQLDFGPLGPQFPVFPQTHIVSAQYAPELSGKGVEYHIASKDDDITLNCEAEGNPPPVFHWSNDRMTISESSSSLNITRVNVSTTYTCTASNYLGNTTKKFHVRVIPNEAAPAAPTAPPTSEATTTREECPITVTPSEIVVRFGDPVSVNCSTSATDVLIMGWEATVGGIRSERRPFVTWMVEKLENWNEKPVCFLSLRTQPQCSKSLAVNLYKTPDKVSVSAVHPGPMLVGTDYHLKCDISNVAPVGKLKVKLYRDVEPMPAPMFNDISVTPQNVSFNFTITPKRNYNGSLFRCVAELHLGPYGPELIPTESSAPYTAIVHYAPEFKEGNFTKEVGVGEDVTLNCSAEGNPPPVMHWNFSSAANLKETTEGRQKTITVTGATSTNAGVYICVATNKVGSLSRSVTLVMKAETSGVPTAIILGLLIVLAFIALLIAIVFILNRQRRHGQYSFVPDNGRNGSNVPMTTVSDVGTA